MEFALYLKPDGHNEGKPILRVTRPRSEGGTGGSPDRFLEPEEIPIFIKMATQAGQPDVTTRIHAGQRVTWQQ